MYQIWGGPFTVFLLPCQVLALVNQGGISTGQSQPRVQCPLPVPTSFQQTFDPKHLWTLGRLHIKVHNLLTILR